MATTGKIGEMPLQFPEVEQYFKRLTFSLTAKGQTAVSKAVLLSTCGQAAFALIETLIAPKDITSDDVKFEDIKKVVIDHLRPKRITHYERHLLHSMTQSSDTVSTYLQKLKEQANRCEFGSLREELILSQFIFGLQAHEVKAKLLAQPSLTLNDAVQHALLHESVTAAAGIAEPAISTTTTGNSNYNSLRRSFTSASNRPTSFHQCYSCGSKDHRRQQCRFRQATCRICQRRGHISTVCHSKATTSALCANSNDELAQSTDLPTNVSPPEESAVVLSVYTGAVSLWHEECKVGNTVVNFLVDTGSQVTIIPASTANVTGFETSNSIGQAVRAYGGGRVTITGRIHDACVTLRGHSHVGTILITADDSRPILGMDFLPHLQLVKQCSPLITDKFGFTASFRLRSDIKMEGMCYPARSLPFSMKSMVETELKRLLAAKIIYPVSSPVISAPIVPVVKQAGASRPIRICGDYSLTLNKLIDRDSYTLPRLEEILHKVSGAQVYSVLDLADAYLQVDLDEASQHLTCISTHLGHFAYTKMQFGISAAPLIFQEAIDTVLKDIPYTSTYQDDILIGTPTHELHDEILQRVKMRLENYNFRVNPSKCQIKQPSVKFLGYNLSKGKLLPNPDRVSALNRLPTPSNKEQLRSLLGSLRHYGCFCPNFSQVARPLYHLLKQNVRWQWTSEHASVVSKLLTKISEGSIVCYDSSKPLYVTSDASKDGLGFVLSHDPEQQEIVWTGSRVLSPAESNYSNIEREALSVVEAVKYFHRFLAGRRFFIQSDHAPLQYIFKPSGSSERISARLQRWAITLKAYDYAVIYRKGERMHLADTLSRLPQPTTIANAPVVDLLELNALQEFAERKSLLSEIRSSDEMEILLLKKYITHGWPAYCKPALQPYRRSPEEYSIQNGVVYRGLRIVPPKSMRQRILYLLHENHPGIVKMIKLSRQYFWWPSMDQHINAFVLRCETCQINARKRTNANLRSWDDAQYFLE